MFYCAKKVYSKQSGAIGHIRGERMCPNKRSIKAPISLTDPHSEDSYTKESRSHVSAHVHCHQSLIIVCRDEKESRAILLSSSRVLYIYIYIIYLYL